MGFINSPFLLYFLVVNYTITGKMCLFILHGSGAITILRTVYSQHCSDNIIVCNSLSHCLSLSDLLFILSSLKFSQKRREG